jgi:hypothetical protein
MVLAFLVLLLCYFGLGQGLLLYQFVHYDNVGAPFFIELHAGDQLMWALHLVLLTWVMATALMLSMAAFDKVKISTLVQQWLPKPYYGGRYDYCIWHCGIAIDVFCNGRYGNIAQYHSSVRF